MTQIREWPYWQRRLYRQARHRVLIERAKQSLCFDQDNNWHGSERPRDIKAYWASLTDVERAFEILQQTDAAVFMKFVKDIEERMPKPHIAP